VRRFAWYSPELNAVVLQTIMEGCRIVFEWDWPDALSAGEMFGPDNDPMTETLWIPLGEL